MRKVTYRWSMVLLLMGLCACQRAAGDGDAEQDPWAIESGMAAQEEEAGRDQRTEGARADRAEQMEGTWAEQVEPIQAGQDRTGGESQKIWIRQAEVPPKEQDVGAAGREPADVGADGREPADVEAYGQEAPRWEIVERGAEEPLLTEQSAGETGPADLPGPVYAKTVRTPGQVTLSFAGDISFAEGYANMAFYHSGGDDITRCIAQDLIMRMDSADILMINNEFAYSDRGQPLSGKTFTFRAKPQMAAELERLSVDIVSLANNHIYDYGETALLDTLDLLDQHAIPRVGAGRNLEEAKKIVYFQTEDMRIAYVSATQIERSYVYTKEATETSPGVLRTYDPTVFLEVIREAKATSDFVVVYVHWGTEGVDRFEADQRQLGYQFIDAGADLVIGDHPHCLQGIEFYKGVPIFYSLGNYWFNSRTLDTGLVEADVSSEGIRELRFVPCLQKGCRTVLVNDPAGRQRVFRYLEGISVNAVLDGEGRVLEKGVEHGTSGF